jgi:superfamily II DNA/RNA helicase
MLPILQSIIEKQDYAELAENGNAPNAPTAIIIAPTRELAVQIHDDTRKFSQGKHV